MGDAPKKAQHFSDREYGVNIKYLGNPFCTNEKLSGFELGVAHPFQIRRVFRLYKNGYRDIEVGAPATFFDVVAPFWEFYPHPEPYQIPSGIHHGCPLRRSLFNIRPPLET